LIGNHERGLDGELALAEVERVFEAGAKEIHDHGVVVALDSKPMNRRDTSYGNHEKKVLKTSLIN